MLVYWRVPQNGWFVYKGKLEFTFFLMDDLGVILFSLPETGLYIDLAPNQSRHTSVSPIFRSSLVPSVAGGLFLKIYWGQICDLGKLTAKAPEN